MVPKKLGGHPHDDLSVLRYAAGRAPPLDEEVAELVMPCYYVNEPIA